MGVKYTKLRGRQCLKINKPIIDLCRIIAIIAEKPVSVTYISKHLRVSWPYARDLIEVLIEANAVAVEGQRVCLFPAPVYLNKVIAIIENKPFGFLPKDPDIIDLILYEILNRVGEVDLTQFISVINLHKQHTDCPK